MWFYVQVKSRCFFFPHIFLILLKKGKIWNYIYDLSLLCTVTPTSVQISPEMKSVSLRDPFFLFVCFVWVDVHVLGPFGGSAYAGIRVVNMTRSRWRRDNEQIKPANRKSPFVFREPDWSGPEEQPRLKGSTWYVDAPIATSLSAHPSPQVFMNTPVRRVGP